MRRWWPASSRPGTFRLAWTQSVTRTRWLAVKLGVVGLASVAVAGLFSLMVTWWSSPLDTVQANRFRAGHLRRARDRPARLRRLRVHARRDGRAARPAHAAGHGHDAGRLRRRPGGHDALGPAAPDGAEAPRHVPLDAARMGIGRGPPRARSASTPTAPDLPERLGHLDDDRRQRRSRDAAATRVTTTCPNLRASAPRPPAAAPSRCRTT